jgi:transcription antitermination factor NusG
MTSNIFNWYTAYTLPNFEKKVRDELELRSVESYLPLQVAYKQWSDRVKKVQVPLFRNYVFVKSMECSRPDAFKVKGILKFVGFDGRPALISEEDINIIKRLENESLEVEPTLVEGTRVKIIRGHLAGLEGRLYAKKGKQRFCVHIGTIQQSLSLEIPGSYLSKV